MSHGAVAWFLKISEMTPQLDCSRGCVYGLIYKIMTLSVFFEYQRKSHGAGGIGKVLIDDISLTSSPIGPS